MSDTPQSRLFALGDVHGCLTALNSVLAAVALRPDDQLVTLGDYVDRGLDSKGVLDRLLELDGQIHLVPVRGNHDQMMLEARDDLALRREWLACGGHATLDSYARTSIEQAVQLVPQRHWDFLESRCVDWFETDTHFFVHAGVFPEVPLDEHERFVLHYEKFVDPLPHCSGKIMVCGHTAQKSGWPLSVGHAICIDTWVYGLGWLTCLDVRSGRFWQANENGVVRTGLLEDLRHNY